MKKGLLIWQAMYWRYGEDIQMKLPLFLQRQMESPITLLPLLPERRGICLNWI